MITIMNLSTIITGINVLLIVALLIVYIRNFAKLKTFFTGGLLIFSFLFLLENSVKFYYGLTMMYFYDDAIQIYALVISLIQLIAFLTLNIITWKH